MKQRIICLAAGIVIFIIGWAAGKNSGYTFLQKPTPIPTIQKVNIEKPITTIDLSALFAPPTKDEIKTVLDDWKSRKPEPTSWKIEKEGDIDGHHLWVVSYVVDGNRIYGLVRFPVDFKTENKYPILIYNHAGNDGVSIENLSQFDNNFLHGSCLRKQFLYIASSFRAEKLDGGKLGIFISEGQASVLDRDVDDIIAMLNGLLENVPQANPQRVVVFGTSRGGGVSLLMGERDNRIKSIAELAGETDFLLHSIENEVTRLMASHLPTINPVVSKALEVAKAYHEGKVDLGEARLELLRSSPAYFTTSLPPVQFHHGATDPIVSVEHSRKLNEMLQSVEKAGPDYIYFEYADGEHNLLTLKGSAERVEDFLCIWAR